VIENTSIATFESYLAELEKGEWVLEGTEDKTFYAGWMGDFIGLLLIRDSDTEVQIVVYVPVD
jgi:hypothetical protein